MLSLPRNVWILAVTFSMAMAGISLLMFIGGLVGTALTPSADLATLPIAAFVVGTAALTIPAALLNQRFGRKAAGYLGLLCSLCSAALAILALNSESFTLYVVSGTFVGAGAAFFQQFRFAAIESLASPEMTGPALSIMMLFTIGGAIIGPELGTLGYNLIPSLADYSGSYFLLAGLILCAMLVFSAFKNPLPPTENKAVASRPIFKIIQQPTFIVALLSAAIGYAVMSFLMTSTPLSMHEHHGFSLADAKWVIQSHLVAMFLPSLFSGYLVKRLGPGNLMIVGSILYLGVAIIALSGQHLMHYWWALVVLGVGWNFLFLSGTTLLPQSYSHSERFKAQAVNDFSVFALQATASLSAAWVLVSFGWNTQVLICIPLTLVVLGSAIYHQWNSKKSSKNTVDDPALEA